MAEITKITTPLMPRENVGNKYKPDTDQAFELNDTSKVHKPVQEGRILDQKQPEGQALRDSMGRAAIEAILKDTGDLMGVIKRLALLVETGVSASQELTTSEAKALLESLFLGQKQLADSIMQQDKASVLFKGGTFDILRDLLGKFEGNPRVANALGNLLKIFEYNVNANSSLKSILLSCDNILDYMFTKDKEQFSSYLDGLAKMLLPQGQNEEARQAGGERPEQNAAQPQNTAQPQNAQQAQNAQPQNAASANAVAENPAAQGGQNADSVLQGQSAQPEQADRPAGQPEAAKAAGQAETPQLTPKEAAQVLKGNLLPLLGEIVVKYNQNERIRDHVMVVVHNIVRVDQGTPEALRDAVNSLVQELRRAANLPDNFPQSLLNALTDSAENAKQARNEILAKLTSIISEALRSDASSPAVVRQAENLMMSLLQNQSSMMNVLHFILPLEMRDDHIFAELYVDPDSQEKANKRGGNDSRKLFLSFESEKHGAYEMSFVQTGEYVDFSMWCPGALVKGLSGMRRHIGDVMQTYGYTMNGFQVEELKRQQSIVEVFPQLLDKRVGIDVRV